MNSKTIARIAMIAAIYTVVSLLLAPLTYGNIQVRIAEALTMLPLIYKHGITGITLGCFLTNLIGAMMGVNPTGYIDAIVGTLATLLAGIATYKLKEVKVKNIPVLAILMPVIFNAIVVGLELAMLYLPQELVSAWIIFGLEVGAGELISVIVGYFIIKALEKKDLFEN